MDDQDEQNHNKTPANDPVAVVCGRKVHYTTIPASTEAFAGCEYPAFSVPTDCGAGRVRIPVRQAKIQAIPA